MVLPRLLHPIDVQIQRRDDTRIFDGKEPYHGQRETTAVDVSAQVKWTREDAVEIQEGGKRFLSDGYILLRKYDLDELGVTFGEGDKIVKIGWQTGLNLYIVRAVPIGHYPDQDGATMLKFYFADRSPVVQSGGATIE